MQPPDGRPWILAHRGASRAAAENTLEAFRLAAAMGSDGVELDARRTADAVVVVHHDEAVDGTAIFTTPFADLRAARPDVPTLAEALDACHGMWVNLEIKNSPAEADWDPANEGLPIILDIVDAAPVEIEVSSFNPLTVAGILDLRPDLPTGWLIDHGSIDPLDAVAVAAAAGHRAIHPNRESVIDDPAPIMEAAHSAGLWVIAWTVDTPRDIERLAAAGIDGIITNVPDVALGVVGTG